MSAMFFGLEPHTAEAAELIIVPCPFEGTVSYGNGTALAPAAIRAASQQVELYDEECGVDIGAVKLCALPALAPRNEEAPEGYLARVSETVAAIDAPRACILGLGGEHSLTPAWIEGRCGTDLSDLTVVQIDAHADLRDSYEGCAVSHACAMRRLWDRGASIIGIGIRSLAREEAELAADSDRITHYTAQVLHADSTAREGMTQHLETLRGPIWLSIDIDGLDLHLCPGTGTPEPGGLGWWDALAAIRAVLTNPALELRGMDIVEVAPMAGTQCNEFTAARLMAKLLTYVVVAEK